MDIAVNTEQLIQMPDELKERLPSELNVNNEIKINPDAKTAQVETREVETDAT
jgi:hypothetical protein